MKNKIHLGISSLYNQYGRHRPCDNNPVLRNRSNSLTCHRVANFSVSSTELDDMFLNNLQLLSDEDHLDTKSLPLSFDNDSIYSNSSNQSSSRYQSSLNIFIKPKRPVQNDKRHSSIIDYSYCNVIPIVDSRQKTPVNSQSVYSSFETLYDPILYATGDESISHMTHQSDQRMTQSLYTDKGRPQPPCKSAIFSEDSDEKTLKSGNSSDDEDSIVSSLESDHEPVTTTNHTKPPSFNPQNVIISRPLGNYPPRDPHYPPQLQPQSIQSPKSHLTISPSCNILNNIFYSPQYNYPMQCHSNQDIRNHKYQHVKDGPPKIPIRKKHRNIQQHQQQQQKQCVNTATNNHNNRSQMTANFRNGHDNRNGYQRNDNQGHYYHSNNNSVRPVSMSNLTIKQNENRNNLISNSPYSPHSTECIKTQVIKRTKGQIW